MASSPAIDYTSRDFEGLRASMFAYAKDVLPQWTSRSVGDMGVLMVELMAYVGDILSYYVDRAAEEAYLQTATLDSSVIALANMLGYIPQTGIPATGTVTLALDASRTDAVIPAGTVLLAIADTGESLYYETTGALALTPTVRSGTVNVRQGLTINKRPVGVANGLPGQSFILDDLPVINESIQVLVDYDRNVTENWTRVDHLADYGPKDKVFTVNAASRQRLRIRFGDGTNGAVPATGLGVYLTYTRGGGTTGNLPVNSTFTVGTSAPQGVLVANAGGIYQSSAMAGGLDADDIEDIRRNVPAALRTRDRAVTLADYVDLALLDPGMVKASAQVRNPQAVYVYALTNDDREVDARITRSRVQKYLATRAPSGVSVALYPAVRKSFTIGTPGDALVNFVQVTAYETYDNVSVTLAVAAALQKAYSTSVATLGQPITASYIYGTIIQVEGVKACAVPKWSVGGAAVTSTDTVLNAWELPVLTGVYVNVTGGVV